MSATTLDPVVTDAEPLTLHDRCDRCGSAAYVRVTLSTANDLLFCSHHYARHEAALAPKVVSIRDERERLAALA